VTYNARASFYHKSLKKYADSKDVEVIKALYGDCEHYDSITHNFSSSTLNLVSSISGAVHIVAIKISNM
jgi:hypothetical protein